MLRKRRREMVEGGGERDETNRAEKKSETRERERERDERGTNEGRRVVGDEKGG